MRYLIILLAVMFAAPAFGNPSSEARMQFKDFDRNCSYPVQAGRSCTLTIGAAETERATAAISFQNQGVICVNGDTGSSTSASTIGLVWVQTVNATTDNGALVVASSGTTLNGGTDCYAVVGSGWLRFTNAVTTPTAILIRGY